jgi:hypothetical protein
MEQHLPVRAPGSGGPNSMRRGVSPAAMERGVRRSDGGADAASFAKTRQLCAALDSEFGAYSPRPLGTRSRWRFRMRSDRR